MTEPTGPIRGDRIAAIDFKADRYCLDCAAEVMEGGSFGVQLNENDGETYSSADGEEVVNRLIDGDIYTLDMGGVVPVNGAADSRIEHWHCGRQQECEHAVSGDKYDHIQHDEMVGVLLDV